MFLPRRLSVLARFVLAAWLLALGSALAAPVMKPVAVELICSGGMLKLVAQGQDEPAASPDCPLCSPPALAAPLPLDWSGVRPVGQGLKPSRHASLRAILFTVPPPARGPPVTRPT